MKKRNPIARVVTHIKPKVIPDKRDKLNEEYMDEIEIEEKYLQAVKDDPRTTNEIITSIRAIVQEIEIRNNIINDELDVLRYKWNTNNQK